MTAKSSVLFMTVTLLIATALGIRAAQATHTVTANIQLVHYIDTGLPEQDVFIEPNGTRAAPPDPDFLGPHEILVPSVMRVEAKPARLPSNLDKQLYGSATMVPHDPFKLGPNPLGPYFKGDWLALTLRQWLAARGSGTYAVSGADAELSLAFQQLVPGGQYALWCGRRSVAPDYREVEKACGAADASQNQFKADAQGNAAVRLHLKALPASTHAAATMLTLTYERDAITSNGAWGGYGLSSHVQLLYAFP